MHQTDLQRYDWAAGSVADGQQPAATCQASARTTQGTASPTTLAMPNRWLQGLLFATALLCCTDALLRQTPLPELKLGPSSGTLLERVQAAAPDTLLPWSARVLTASRLEDVFERRGQ
jgi:hypothetical protein